MTKFKPKAVGYLPAYPLDGEGKVKAGVKYEVRVAAMHDVCT